MDNGVKKLAVINSDKNLFNSDDEYVIPLYQRAFAWEDKQIAQLIEDITDIPEETNHYYIGTLIVSHIKGNGFEVVDGQQRLTCLYLLLNCLGKDVKSQLRFACRNKSNYTLQHIKDIIDDNRSKMEAEQIESNIEKGLNIIQELIGKDSNREKLERNLPKVILYRIEVPKHTDLNRYFEIMNTRGEQLEQHDILKASLMSELTYDTDKVIFAKIWDACSDMTGYVQMHFVSDNNEIRNKLFGENWNNKPSDNWEDYKILGQEDDSSNKPGKIMDIIKSPPEQVARIEEDSLVRFYSIIEYPYFLLQTLKVFIKIKGIHHQNVGESIIPEQMDDKKLNDTFKKVIKHGIVDDKKILAAQFSKDFIICLLRTRYLFDQYIIKREYANTDSDGEWSLKSLHAYVKQNKRRPNYQYPSFTEDEKDNIIMAKTNMMIQSALRVSYTSPKTMHWITQLLYWLSEENRDMAEYSEIAESLAKEAVKRDFLDKYQPDDFEMGIYTPHIVFNYLDYLLWKETKDKKEYDNFVFEFRNSVEHWYPRNPSEGTFERWEKGVDRFGNLCIVQRRVNSKFSNMSPEAKKSTFTQIINKGSLKLRRMSNYTVTSLDWKESACKRHEDEMIAILKNACDDISDKE